MKIGDALFATGVIGNGSGGLLYGTQSGPTTVPFVHVELTGQPVDASTFVQLGTQAPTVSIFSFVRVTVPASIVEDQLR